LTVGNAGDLRGGKGNNLKLRVVSIHHIEIVKITTGCPHNDSSLARCGSTRKARSLFNHDFLPLSTEKFFFFYFFYPWFFLWLIVTNKF
jgi:hypothetical protein